MAVIERANPALENVRPKDHTRLALDMHRLGHLIDLVSGMQMADKGPRSRDVLERSA